MLDKSKAYEIINTELYQYLYNNWSDKLTTPIIPANKSTIFGAANRDPNNYSSVLRFNVLTPAKQKIDIGSGIYRVDGSIAASYLVKVNSGLKASFPIIDKFVNLFDNQTIKTLAEPADCIRQFIFLDSQIVDLGQESTESGWYNISITIPFYVYVK